MKRFIFLLSLVISGGLLWSQVQQGIKYQAVIRDNNGDIIANQNISLKISFLKGSPTGTVEYSETHATSTNEFGLVNVAAGSGTVISGDFSSIAWGDEIYFMQTEVDPTGGSNYQILGTSQVLAVPYAYYAEEAGNVVYSDTSATNELQTLSLAGNNLSISNGNSVTLPSCFDFSFPDGMDNIIPISMDKPPYTSSFQYTVPQGYNFYIVYADGGFLFADGVNLGRSFIDAKGGLEQPLIIGENSVLTTVVDHALHISGFLSPAGVSPVYLSNLSPQTPYIVPENKCLVILNFYNPNSGALYYINGIFHSAGRFLHMSTDNALGLPLILTEYDTLYSTNPYGSNEMTFNGYLLDIYQGPPTFTCGQQFVDPRDSQTYNTVEIGTQCWMAENLNIGTFINSSNNQSQQSPEIIEKFCYGDIPANCDEYGGIYQWDEIMQYVTTSGVQGICPEGWHIPTDEEWCILEILIDPTVDCFSTGWRGVDAGGKLKEAGTAHWTQPNIGATNSSGFTALPSGLSDTGITFSGINIDGFMWSSSFYIHQPNQIWFRSLHYYSAKVNRTNYHRGHGMSVRCLKN